MIRIFQCPFCSVVIQVSTLKAVRFRCGKCGALLLIPEKKIIVPRKFRKVGLVLGFAAILVLLTFGYILIQKSNGNYGSSSLNSSNSNDNNTAGTIEDYKQSKSKLVKKLTSEFGGGRLVFSEPAPFLLVCQAGQNSIDIAERENYEEILLATYQTVKEHFKDSEYIKIQPIKDLLPVVILNSKEDYDFHIRNKRKKMDYSGIYDYETKRTIIYYSKDFDISKKLVHETTHQLLHYFSKYNRFNTFWIQEGLACYFEGYSVKKQDGIITLEKALNKNYLRYIKRKDPVSLANFLELKWAEFDSRYHDESLNQHERDEFALLRYSQAWAFVYFLMVEHKRLLEEYIVYEPNDKDPKALFERLWKQHSRYDISQLQLDFFKFLAALPNE